MVIGNGAAGRAVAEELVRGGGRRVTLIGREHPVPISRPGLMYRAMGAMRTADLELPVPAEVEAVHGEVVAWSPDERWVQLVDGCRWGFDQLVWAIGAVARAFPGEVSVRTLGLQSLGDAEALAEAQVRRWAVVGGGLVGAELAEWGRGRGAETHWVVRDARLWSRWLRPEESEALERRVTGHGVCLHLGVELAALAPVLDVPGGAVEVDAVGLAIGVEPAPLPGGRAGEWPGVHRLGEAKSWDEAIRSGRNLGRQLTGRPAVPPPQVAEERLRCFDRSVTWLERAVPEREFGWLDAAQARSLRVGTDAAGRWVRVVAMGWKLRSNRVAEALKQGLSSDQIPVHPLFNEPEGTRLPIASWSDLQPLPAP